MRHIPDHSLLDDALDLVARKITGSDTVVPRPGQVALSHEVFQAMNEGDGQAVSRAGTGVGKSVGYLTPAALMAAAHGERTVVSTESKALQNQLVDKDLPVVCQAVSELTGADVDYAVFKGFNNYACPAQAMTVAADLLHEFRGERPPAPLLRGKSTPADRVGNTEACAETGHRLAALGQDAADRIDLPETVSIDGRRLPFVPLVMLSAWAMIESTEDGDGDRSLYPGDCDDALWNEVSIDPDLCPGSKCPLAHACPARASRDRASHAQIVVTNHHLLAMQAGSGIPTIMSNKKLGRFDHLVIDECHALPKTVRSAARRSASGVMIRRIVTRLNDLSRASQARTAATMGNDLADRMDEALDTFLGHGEVRVIGDDDTPLDGLSDGIRLWSRLVREALAPLNKSGSERTDLKVRRLKGRLSELVDTLDAVEDTTIPQARWVERDRGSGKAAVIVSPVDVAGGIRANLFTTEVTDEATGEVQDCPVSVSMVSATIPRVFCREVGVRNRVTDHPSPFADAYRESLLYVPRLAADELPQVARNHAGRWRLDVDLFAVWAARIIPQLCLANGGSALVLSARGSDGKAYADALRRSDPSLRVLSQWDDGKDLRRQVDAWRSDRDAVLVGTRSLMTGVDAQGDTCTLVIADRPSRSPNNVVDDARVTLLTDNGMEKFAAIREVYASDAALLLEQAAGRLIRSGSDRGVVAVLDPRLLPGPVQSPHSDRALYLQDALGHFPNRTSSMETVLDFLTRQAAIRQAA